MGEGTKDTAAEDKQMLMDLNTPFFKSDSDRLSQMLRLLFNRHQQQNKVIINMQTEIDKLKDGMSHKAGKATVENVTNRVAKLEETIGGLGVDELQESIRLNEVNDQARSEDIAAIKEKLEEAKAKTTEVESLAQRAMDEAETKLNKAEGDSVSERVSATEQLLEDHKAEIENLQGRVGGGVGIPEGFEERKALLEEQLMHVEGADAEGIAHEIAVIEGRENDNLESRITDAEAKLVELLEATKTALSEGRLSAWEDMAAMIGVGGGGKGGASGGRAPKPPSGMSSAASSRPGSAVTRPTSGAPGSAGSSRPGTPPGAATPRKSVGFAAVEGPPASLGEETIEQFERVESQVKELLQQLAAGLLSGGASAEMLAGVGNQTKQLGDIGDDMRIVTQRLDAVDAHCREHDEALALLKAALDALREDLGGVASAAYMAPGLAAQMEGMAMEIQALRKKTGGKSVMQAFVSGLSSHGQTPPLKSSPAPAASGVSNDELSKVKKQLDMKATHDEVVNMKNEAVTEALEAYNRLMLAMEADEESGDKGRALKFKCLSCDRDVQPRRPAPLGLLPSKQGLLPNMEAWKPGASPATPAGPGLYAQDIRQAARTGEYYMHGSPEHARAGGSPPRAGHGPAGGAGAGNGAFTVSPRQAGGRPRSAVKPRPATAGGRFSRTPRHDIRPHAGVGDPLEMQLRPQA